MNTLSSLQLDAFYALAQVQNFTQAAQQLHVTQSALSQRILNLEGELETTLFIRDRSGARLTDVGHELLRYCQAKGSLEAEFLSTLKADSKSELKGILRIAGYSSVVKSVLMPALAPLLKSSSGIRAHFLSRELKDLPNLLKTGEVDFIVLDHKLDKEGIASLKLGQEQQVLVEKNGYSGPEVFLDHDEDDLTTVNYLRLARKKAAGQTKDHWRNYCDDSDGILEGVRLGLGRAVVSKHLALSVSGIRIVDPELSVKTPVLLHYYERPFYPRLHKAVVDALERKAPTFLDV